MLRWSWPHLNCKDEARGPTHLMVVMVKLCMGRMVICAEFEDICEGREDKQQQFQEYLLRSSDSKQQWEDKHQLDLDHLYHQQDREERHH